MVIIPCSSALIVEFKSDKNQLAHIGAGGELCSCLISNDICQGLFPHSTELLSNTDLG